MREVRIETVGGSARVGVRVTVADVEMTARTAYLDDDVLTPVGVFGGDREELEFAVEVTFPDLPLLPVRETRTVRVT